MGVELRIKLFLKGFLHYKGLEEYRAMSALSNSLKILDALDFKGRNILDPVF